MIVDLLATEITFDEIFEDCPNWKLILSLKPGFGDKSERANVRFAQNN